MKVFILNAFLMIGFVQAAQAGSTCSGPKCVVKIEAPKPEPKPQVGHTAPVKQEQVAQEAPAEQAKPDCSKCKIGADATRSKTVAKSTGFYRIVYEGLDKNDKPFDHDEILETYEEETGQKIFLYSHFGKQIRICDLNEGEEFPRLAPDFVAAECKKQSAEKNTRIVPVFVKGPFKVSREFTESRYWKCMARSEREEATSAIAHWQQEKDSVDTEFNKYLSSGWITIPTRDESDKQALKDDQQYAWAKINGTTTDKNGETVYLADEYNTKGEVVNTRRITKSQADLNLPKARAKRISDLNQVIASRQAQIDALEVTLNPPKEESVAHVAAAPAASSTGHSAAAPAVVKEAIAEVVPSDEADRAPAVVKEAAAEAKEESAPAVVKTDSGKRNKLLEEVAALRAEAAQEKSIELRKQALLREAAEKQAEADAIKETQPHDALEGVEEALVGKPVKKEEVEEVADAKDDALDIEDDKEEGELLPAPKTEVAKVEAAPEAEEIVIKRSPTYVAPAAPKTLAKSSDLVRFEKEVEQLTAKATRTRAEQRRLDWLTKLQIPRQIEFDSIAAQ